MRIRTTSLLAVIALASVFAPLTASATESAGETTRLSKYHHVPVFSGATRDENAKGIVLTYDGRPRLHRTMTYIDLLSRSHWHVLSTTKVKGAVVVHAEKDGHQVRIAISQKGNTFSLAVSKPSVGEQAHWSLFDYILPENRRSELREKIGPSWFEGSAYYRLVHVFMTVLVVLLILFLVVRSRRRLGDPEKAIIPEKTLTAYTFMELVTETVWNTMKDLMGEKYARKSLPLIGTLAFFIFFGNILGMVPGLLPATDNLNTNLACALVVFVLYNYWGIREHGFINYFKHFCGPIHSLVALPLMILMFAVEMVSHLARPVTLGVRLMGNMFGDHTIVSVFLGFKIPLLPLPVMVLGLVVVLVQTMVFCLLSMVYVAIATAHDEH